MSTLISFEGDDGGSSSVPQSTGDHGLPQSRQPDGGSHLQNDLLEMQPDDSHEAQQAVSASTDGNQDSNIDDEQLEESKLSDPDKSASQPRRPIASLPRPQTFQRQESERRERLLPVRPSPTEKRAASSDRRRGLSANAVQRKSVPEPFPSFSGNSASDTAHNDFSGHNGHSVSSTENILNDPAHRYAEIASLPIPDLDLGFRASGPLPGDEEDGDEVDDAALREICERVWILNITMHYRDQSDREKFFITYAETPTQWRRVTVSLDYRNPCPNSLEADLSTLRYSNDKNFHIFKAIRDSLPEIRWTEQVTNLKLVTAWEDKQLHIHVHEDANEIFDYPEISLFAHIDTPRVPESKVEFQSHLSGYVYKVRVDGKVVVKKEIPGPDTTAAFLYEVNALDSLDSAYVAHMKGLVTDEDRTVVKGILIEYAPQGALCDLLYDSDTISWQQREKWAKQVVQGLSDIHEAGYIQGDFTLSNIVIDEADNAQIIDINRRGCPIGWEPPELSRLIDSGQRISMNIGAKTDLFQLGMVLWALVEAVDDPDRIERPLPPVEESTPQYLQDAIQSCLSDRPQDRLSAKDLMKLFPFEQGNTRRQSLPSSRFVEYLSSSSRLNEGQLPSWNRMSEGHISSDATITLERLDAQNRRRSAPQQQSRAAAAGAADGNSPVFSDQIFTPDQVSYLNPADVGGEAADYDIPGSNPESTKYFDSAGSWVVPRPRHRSARGGTGRGGAQTDSRGVSPGRLSRRPSSPFYSQSAQTSSTSLSSPSSPSSNAEPPSRRRERCGSVFSDEDEVAERRREHAAERREPATEGVRLDGGAKLKLQGLLHMDSGFDEVMAKEGVKEASLLADDGEGDGTEDV